MRQFPLAEQTDGINLMRSKGGASPKSLFDLKNGWVSPKRTINARPGSVKHLTFPAGTIGVIGFEDKFHTFAAIPVTNANAEIVVNVLRHPTGGAATLLRIHRAFPVLARLYVVAEFTDGVIRHYWLENPAAWTASTVFSFGDRTIPTVSNGYYYVLKTQNVTAAWTANNTVVVGQFRQPSTINGLRYEVTAVTGTAPIRTSNDEPIWPIVVGATVTERRYLTDPQDDPGTTVPPVDAATPPREGARGPGSEFYPFGRGKNTGTESTE